MPQYLHKDAKDLLWKMLTVDPAKRITITEIKQHPFFRGSSDNVPPFVPLDQIVSEYCEFDVCVDDAMNRNLILLILRILMKKF